MFESVDWKISKNLISYDFAISEMEKRVLEIKQNSAKELVWLLEHQPIYTGGTSAKKEDLKNDKIETRYTGRGGQWTWHGPGQRVVYLMLNLKNREQDVKAYVYALEELIILTLGDFSINGIRINNDLSEWLIYFQEDSISLSFEREKKLKKIDLLPNNGKGFSKFKVYHKSK